MRQTRKERTPRALAASIAPPAAAVLHRLAAAGYQAYLVGGCVRDLLLGRAPRDWDVAAPAPPEAVLALFGAAARPTGLRHGTVTVSQDGMAIEVTAFRRDGHYSDRRRPDAVYFTRDLTEDLARRDFTVNAMAMDGAGQVLDPFGGREDLAAGCLRCVGEAAARFREDPLRILRGMRLAAALGLVAERDTDRAMQKGRSGLQTVAAERIWQELAALLTGASAPAVLRQYPQIVGVFWPEVREMVGFHQRNRHHCYDVWEHSLHALAETEPVLALRCAALLHDVGKPRCFSLDEQGEGHFYGHVAASRAMTEDMLRRLRCPRAVEETVVTLVDWHDREIPGTAQGLTRALHRLGEERLRLLLKLKRADNLAQAPAYRGRQAEIGRAEEILEELLAKKACFSLRELAVKGNDLTARGYAGPEVGVRLRRLLEQVMAGKVPNDRAALLAALESGDGEEA